MCVYVYVHTYSIRYIHMYLISLSNNYALKYARVCVLYARAVM